MSEHTTTAIIGSELEVEVFFEYKPSEPETLEEPGCLEAVEITAVQVPQLRTADHQADITTELSADCLLWLADECLESLGEA